MQSTMKVQEAVHAVFSCSIAANGKERKKHHDRHTVIIHLDLLDSKMPRGRHCIPQLNEHANPMLNFHSKVNLINRTHTLGGGCVLYIVCGPQYISTLQKHTRIPNH